MVSRKVAVVESAHRTSEGGQVTGAIQWDAVLIWHTLHRHADMQSHLKLPLNSYIAAVREASVGDCSIKLLN